MSEPEPTAALSQAVGIAISIAKGVGVVVFWLAQVLGRVFVFAFKILVTPLTVLANILLVIFSPVLYILSYMFSWAQSIWAFFVSLEPLYIFFGAAATIGVLAGILLGISSSFFNSYLLSQRDDETESETDSPRSKRSYNLLEESTSTDFDWQLLDTPVQRRRPASGLLGQTIHEEDDDSEY